MTREEVANIRKEPQKPDKNKGDLKGKERRKRNRRIREIKATPHQKRPTKNPHLRTTPTQSRKGGGGIVGFSGSLRKVGVEKEGSRMFSCRGWVTVRGEEFKKAVREQRGNTFKRVKNRKMAAKEQEEFGSLTTIKT